MQRGGATQLRETNQNTEFLVFSSAEAADYVMYGATSIQPIGGFTGNAPYPSVDQVQQLIETGEISFASAPNSQAPTG